MFRTARCAISELSYLGSWRGNVLPVCGRGSMTLWAWFNDVWAGPISVGTRLHNRIISEGLLTCFRSNIE